MSTTSVINPFAKATTGNATNPVEPTEVEETVEAAPAPTPAPKAAPKPPTPKGAAKAPAAGLPVPGAAQAASAPTDGDDDASPMPGLPMPGQHNPHGGAGAGDLDDDFVIDLSNVVQGGRDFIGVGRHLLAATGVETGFSKEGNRKIVFSYEVISGDFIGKKAQSHVAMHLDWKIDQNLRAMGIVTADRKTPTIGEIKRECIGRVVIGDFVKGTYNNRETVDFNRVDPPDEIGISAGTTVDDLIAGNTD